MKFEVPSFNYKSIPNWLTWLRLVLVPFFVILLINPSRWMTDVAAVIFIIAALTDYFDGYLARRFKAVSDFGKLLDPLVDKMLVLSGLIMLASIRSDIDARAWVPGWMVVLVVLREIWVTGIRGVAASRGVIVPAGLSGKFKSALQMVAVVLLLLHDRVLSIGGLKCEAQTMGLSLLLLSLLFSYIGAFEYTALVFNLPSEEAPSDTQ